MRRYYQDKRERPVKPPKSGLCQRCRQRRPLTKHHVTPKSDNAVLTVYADRNIPRSQAPIMWLCRSCHDVVHGMSPTKWC